MKKFLPALVGIFVLLLASACSTQQVSPAPEHFVGKMNTQQLLSDYAKFQASYDAFTVSEQQISQIESWPNNLTIDVYFGTWCPDSQREVPRLLKVLTHNKQVQLSLLALDFKKSDPQGLAKKAGITNTATFIIKLADVEIGRIIEQPDQNLIDDISLMVKSVKPTS